MNRIKSVIAINILLIYMFSCKEKVQLPEILKPVIVTEKVKSDTDDPAIWINPEDPSKSLIIGTDKGGESGLGGLYTFNLEGKIDTSKIITLQRPNNVDIAYGLEINGIRKDIAVCTERYTNKIRVVALPEMKLIDGGGINVFEDDTLKSPMGIALYKNPENGIIYAIVGRKTGPADGYLYQYKLMADQTGIIKGELVRKFGKFSGNKEIEAIVVDSDLGYVYYSDEGAGVRKYYVHPDSSNKQLALFATESVKEDHEGLSIYKINAKKGYLLLSDQQANQFHVFPREGTENDPHLHSLIKTIKTSSEESDGSDVTNVSLNNTFKNGLFVAMSTDSTFQFYRWEDLAGKELIISPSKRRN